MQPLGGYCGVTGGACIPNPAVLRLDDIAALNRIYPVTSANIGSFTGKVLTAANTVSIQGTLNFRSGSGMQGVVVSARPLDGSGNPMFQDTVTFVSGAYFNGNHGNSVTGWLDSKGNRLDRFGSDDATLQGYFDLSGIPLPAGVTSASYQISFEPVNANYFGTDSVGPYLLGSPTPSGTLPTETLTGLQAGSAQTITVTVTNSAAESVTATAGVTAGIARPVASVPRAVGDAARAGADLTAESAGAGSVRARTPDTLETEVNPLPLPPTGNWTSRLGTVGAADWFILPVRGNRIFTIVTQALDETGQPSGSKAMPSLGVWDGFDQTGTAAAGSVGGLNGFAPGETSLQIGTAGKDVVRLAVVDERGDGRPDYTYRGWMLYADTVTPARIPTTGGTIAIRGMGFRTGDSVTVGGVSAVITSLLPTEITAVVAAAKTGVTGSQDVEVDDLSLFSAATVIPSGVSYDSATGDALTVVTAPSGQIPMHVPLAFAVVAKGSDGTAASGDTVRYSVTSGSATLGCGSTSCSVTARGDGSATMLVTSTSTAATVVTVSLTNGASVQAHFYGGAPAVLTAETPVIYVASGATVPWAVQAIGQSGGNPTAGLQVTWASVSGIVAPGSAVATNSSGVASATLTVGPLGGGQTAISNACLTGGTSCAAFTAYGAQAQLAGLLAISGAAQSMPVGTTAAPVVLEVVDTGGHPMVSATVTVSQSLYAWQPPCPRRGRCPAAQLLSTSSTTVTSALDGTISITPLTLSGVATNLIGVAATGNTASLKFTVEQHP
jgi:hypothetical protein